VFLKHLRVLLHHRRLIRPRKFAPLAPEDEEDTAASNTKIKYSEGLLHGRRAGERKREGEGGRERRRVRLNS